MRYDGLNTDNKRKKKSIICTKNNIYGVLENRFYTFVAVVHDYSFVYVCFWGREAERDFKTGEVPRSCIYNFYSVRAVPIPLSVSSSRRMQFSTLPSTMVTMSTPSARAERQHSTFGIMPPLMVPSA